MLTSIATRAASASPGAASASAARDRRQAITVAGMMQKDDGDLDEDDFLWEKLPAAQERRRRALGAEERREGRTGRVRAALPRPRRRHRHHRRDVGRR